MPKSPRSIPNSDDPAYVPLAGSRKDAPNDAVCLGDAPSEEQGEVTIRLRRNEELPSFDMAWGDAPLLTADERKAYETRHGASAADLQAVAEFARRHSLKILESSGPKRIVRVSGSVKNLQKAFRVALRHYKTTGVPDPFRAREGTIHVPAALDQIVVGVFGLDRRPFARPSYVSDGLLSRMQVVAMPRTGVDSAFRGFTGKDLASLYQFPANTTGKGQTIAILELGGGYRPAEAAKYFKAIGVNRAPGSLVAVGTNDPDSDRDSNVEVLLDIEVAGAAAPDAKLVVYFAPDASGDSFLNVLLAAIHDTANAPQVISISWGGPESETSDQYTDNFHDALDTARRFGITVCAAAGDDGSADYPVNDPQRLWDRHAHVDHPAVDPYVVACGGTRLLSGAQGFTEVVWDGGKNVGTGGGVSRVFPLPDYQQNAGVPPAANPPGPVRRGVPDIAGDAAQESGYRVLCDGHWYPDAAHNRPPVGGTSAVAPLMAALFARLNEALGRPLGFVHPLLYRLPASSGAFRDITDGTNGDYNAGPGWDACTGLGVPNGEKLLAALRAAPTDHFSPITEPAPTVVAPEPSSAPAAVDNDEIAALLRAQIAATSALLAALTRGRAGATRIAPRTGGNQQARLNAIIDFLRNFELKRTGYLPSKDENPLDKLQEQDLLDSINEKYFDGKREFTEADLDGNTAIWQIARAIMYVQDGN